MTSRPLLSTWQVCKLCIGAFGIQFCFALPQANATRIFQNLGASLDSVPLLWLAGPITGLLVQPLVGYYSDRTWTRLGRRKPYFLLGALLAAGALVAMPNASLLWMAVITLWMLDASVNLTMGPFRAFVADQMSPAQRSTGYLAYMFFVSVGAVVGSLLPWLFSAVGIPSDAPGKEIGPGVKYAFYLGASLLMVAVCASALSTREYPPEALDQTDLPEAAGTPERSPETMRRHGLTWLALATGGLIVAKLMDARAGLYVLIAGSFAYGLFLCLASRMQNDNAFTIILNELDSMSASTRSLALTQFFSWFTLFAIFTYTLPAVASMQFGSITPGSAAYEAAADWVGVLFATYNAIGALAATIIPAFVRRLGMRRVHQINLWIGAGGLLSMLLIRDPKWLLLPMVGFGLAWGSIVALPYAMLANNLPSRKMGVSIGIFNIFIVIPQLLAAGVLGSLLGALADGNPSFVFVIGAVCWFLAGLVVMRVRDSAI